MQKVKKEHYGIDTKHVDFESFRRAVVEGIILGLVLACASSYISTFCH